MADNTEVELAVLKTRLDRLETEVDEIKELTKKLHRIEYTLTDVGLKVDRLVEKLEQDKTKAGSKPFQFNWNLAAYVAIGLVVLMLVLAGFNPANYLGVIK
jgi:hypothetical protein